MKGLENVFGISDETEIEPYVEEYIERLPLSPETVDKLLEDYLVNGQKLFNLSYHVAKTQFEPKSLLAASKVYAEMTKLLLTIRKEFTGGTPSNESETLTLDEAIKLIKSQ